MSYLDPNLTPIRREDLREGDTYLVARFLNDPDPEWVERHIWPSEPDRDPGYHPRRYLLRRPVRLTAGQMGTATLLDGRTVTGYVTHIRFFQEVKENGALGENIHARNVTSFTQARAPQPADPATVELLAAHIMLGLEVADTMEQARRITGGQDHQARRYQKAALAAHTLLLGGDQA